MQYTATPTPTAESIRDLPATVPVQVAARYFGIGKEGTYRLIQAGEFPVPVLRIGRRLICTRAALAEALGVHLDAPSPRESHADDLAAVS